MVLGGTDMMTPLTLLPDSLQKSKRVNKLKSLEAAQPGARFSGSALGTRQVALA